jgi:hypothetical protein
MRAGSRSLDARISCGLAVGFVPAKGSIAVRVFADFFAVQKPYTGGMDAQRINSAAQALLTACFEAADPVKALHIELDRLRASGDWTEIELRRIQELTLSTAKAIAANV